MNRGAVKVNNNERTHSLFDSIAVLPDRAGVYILQKIQYGEHYLQQFLNAINNEEKNN